MNKRSVSYDVGLTIKETVFKKLLFIQEERVPELIKQAYAVGNFKRKHYFSAPAFFPDKTLRHRHLTVAPVSTYTLLFRWGHHTTFGDNEFITELKAFVSKLDPEDYHLLMAGSKVNDTIELGYSMGNVDVLPTLTYQGDF